MFPLLTTERLLLTLPPTSAAERLAAYCRANEEHHRPWSPSRPAEFCTAGYWRRQLEGARLEYQRAQSVRFVLFRREAPEGAVVGQCNFTGVIRGALQGCYLGYHLDQAAVGQGLMEEACRAAIPWVFQNLGLHRVTASYMPTNERSARLLRRLGFTVEGFARDYLYLDGAWRDHLITSLLAPDAQPPTA
jgi:ribosomal-protein-alanine N-acetyltransferase